MAALPSSRSLFEALFVVVGAFAVAACQSRGPIQPAVPGAELRLIESRALDLPDSCRASGSVVVDFTVLASGQTDDIRPAAAPECVQQALTAWVASFRYAPVGQSTPAAVEWLLVEARKGS